MKYELTDETHPYRSTLHRIRALRDIPETGVKSGDLGGWVESESNLDQTGTARVSDTAWVSGNATVSDTATVSGGARVSGARHVTTLGPVGSENRTATIYRNKDGAARIVAGCWTGTPDELAERIMDAWPDANPADRKAWTSDYKTVIKLARKREKGWNR